MSKIKLIMTLLVRDEEDIVEDNICFHLNHGVDFIVATDNGSTDKTPQILKKYQKGGYLHYQKISKHTYEQSLWVSQMAKLAVNRFRASHLFHCDADEFWYPNSKNLKTLLPQQNEVYMIKVLNYIPPQKILISKHNLKNFKLSVHNPLLKPKTGQKRDSGALLLYPYPPKILTSSLFTDIAAGNHDIITNQPYIKKEVSHIIVHHFPIRNYQQFQKRVIRGGTAMLQSPIKDPSINWHIRDWYKIYQQGKLLNEYSKLSLQNNSQKVRSKNIVRHSTVPKRIRYAKIINRIKNIL